MIEATNIQSIRGPVLLRKNNSKNFLFWVLTGAAHLPLGVLVYSAGPFAILHPIAVFLIGIYWAVNKRYRLERVAFAIAYLIGAEVLWRMAQVPVFWEFGKYGGAAIAITALATRGFLTIPKLPVTYLAVLIPASIITLTERDLSSAQAILSTQLSGPFFLVVACWFFSYCEFNEFTLRQLLFSVMVPLFSVAFATLFFTVSSADIQFNGESNFATSGGFGPNQVSAMLGLGAFVAIACLLVFQNASKYKVYLMVAAVLFAAQSVLTFSRGGIYNALGGVIAISLVTLQLPSVAARRVVPIIGLAMLFVAFVFPVLDNFTGGALKERFEDTGTSNRAEIAESDVQLFWENPLLGVGVGSSYAMREELLDHKAMTHTEFSRLLSEHGLFGIMALLLLACILVVCFIKQRTVLGRAFVAGAAVWSCLFMTNAAMRLAAPSFMLGLTYSMISISGQTQRKSRSKTLDLAPFSRRDDQSLLI